MKKIALVTFLLIVSLKINAQNAPTRTKLDETSIVRGDDGNVYPYALWNKLMSTGKYAIRSRGTYTDNGKPEYLIHELSDSEKTALLKKMPKPRPSDSFKEGEDFKGFKVTDINGNKFDLREAKGKVIVLNFWFINCAPCKQEIPDLNELVAAYKDNPDIVFLAIANDQKYDLKNFLETTAYSYNIIDNGRYLAEKYGVKSYPTHVVIDKDGKIKFSTIGLAMNTISWIKKSISESL